MPAAGVSALFLLMAAIGLAMDANYATIIVLGQACLPFRVGVASGITIGLSVGLGAACAWLLGVLADNASLMSALHWTTVLAAAAAVLAVSVPRDVGRRAAAARFPLRARRDLERRPDRAAGNPGGDRRPAGAGAGAPSALSHPAGVAGLGLALIPGAPTLVLPPDIALLALLPPLPYSSAFFTSLRDLRATCGRSAGWRSGW